MKIFIGIPAYNEEKDLGRVLTSIHTVMHKTSYDYTIHVRDDGSYDKTATVAQEHQASVRSHKTNRGLAFTFQREIEDFLASDADVFVHTDADGQYPASAIPSLLAQIALGCDLVLGSRFLSHDAPLPFLKRWGNKAFARVLTRLTRISLTDTTTGFRAFTRDVASQVQFINTFTYTQEQIIRAAKLGFRIIEIPITAQKTRESKLFKNPLEYAVKAWINILRIYRDYDPLKFFGAIGLFFFSFGVLLGCYFLYLHFFGGGITGHIGLLFLMIIFLFMGLQFVAFGFLADMRKS